MWIVTGREDNMATVNEVTLVAYGEDGISDPVTLGNGRDGTYFQKGNNDDFKVWIMSFNFTFILIFCKK